MNMRMRILTIRITNIPTLTTMTTIMGMITITIITPPIPRMRRTPA